MNRRSFFASLAALGAACSAPSLFLPKLERVHWKKVHSGLWVMNPEWVKAEYECYFINMPMKICPEALEEQAGMFAQEYHRTYAGMPKNALPLRYDYNGVIFKPVPPFIEL